MTYTRRRFLTTASLAGAAGLFRTPPSLAAEGVLETTAVRLMKTPGICIAPQYVAEEFLRAEGFTDIRYVEIAGGERNNGAAGAEGQSIDPWSGALSRGNIDFTLNYATNFVRAIDAGVPITLLAGVHVGCYELFANAGIRSISDLKGKGVGVQALGAVALPDMAQQPDKVFRIGILSPAASPSTKAFDSLRQGLRELGYIEGANEEREYANDGGLLSYRRNVSENFRQAAGYVDKILRGAKPADLPIQQPTRFDLVVNLKTANALGLTIPPSILDRADKVIE
jgi:hypothetical protein